jgi:hypothetical protein
MQTKMTQFEALCSALELAITAPTDKKSRECVAFCEAIAIGMSELDLWKGREWG